jgi:hypothetical protein
MTVNRRKETHLEAESGPGIDKTFIAPVFPDESTEKSIEVARKVIDL